MNLFKKSKSVKFAANPGIDNTRMYKFMTEETDMKLINTDTANSITFDELVYYLAMPDKNKIIDKYLSKDGPEVGNAKRLLKNVLMRFSKDPQGQLNTANQIINVLNSSNKIIEDLSKDNIDDKIEKIINQSVPAVPELKTPSSLAAPGVQPGADVGLKLPPPEPEPDLGPGGQPGAGVLGLGPAQVLPPPNPYQEEQDDQEEDEEDEDSALGPGGQPGAADLGLPEPEPEIQQTDLDDPEFKRVFDDIEDIKKDLAEKDTLLEEYNRKSNEMFDKLKKISNSDTAAVTDDSLGITARDELEEAKTAYIDNSNSQTLSNKRRELNDATKMFIMINIKQITEDFKNEIFNAKQDTIENYIANISTKNTQIDGLLGETDSNIKFSILKSRAKNLKYKIEKQISVNENVTKNINSIKIIKQELQGTIFAKSKDIMPSKDIITQNYYDRIVVYIFLKDTDLTYVQLPMTKKYESKYKDYDNTINNLLQKIIDKPNIGDLNSIKYNLYGEDDESIMRKFLDIDYKIVGYKNIIDNYNKNVQAEYAQDKKIDTRKRLCESIINYILNFFGPNYQNINNCFDFAGVEDADDDKKWLENCLYPDYMDIVFNQNPLPESSTSDGSKEAAINIATAKAIDEIAEATAGDGKKYYFVEELPYTSDNPEDRYRLAPIHAAASDSQSDTIKYLFVALSNYPTHVQSEFEKLKWPFNRLIPMIQEITAELKRVGRTTDGPENVADGVEGLGKLTFPAIPGMSPRVYKGGAKPVKKTFKKKSSKRKKTHKKLLNY